MQKPVKTPAFANLLLRLFCRKEYQDEVRGDLEENFLWRAKERSRSYAVYRYYLDVLSAIRLIILGANPFSSLSASMLFSFAKSSLRSFSRNKVYALLNMFGLALGMSAALYILEYVSDELNYDEFSQSDRIFRVYQDFEKNNERQFRTSRTEGTLAANLIENIPEIKEAARLIDYTWLWEGKNVFTLSDKPDKTYIESAAFFADPAIVDLFDLKLIQGGSRLDEPYTVLLSVTMAEKYFGSIEKSIGQLIRFSSVKKEPDLLVTGVYQFPAHNMQVKPMALISYNTFNRIIGERGPHNMLGVESSLTYVKLKEEATMSGFRNNLERYSLAESASTADITNGLRTGPILVAMPVSDLHLYSNYPDEVGKSGDITSVRILLIIAVLIVAIAWVNYINLATAHSLNRLKELGLRKVMGANKSEIVYQFFIEALLLNVFAFGLAMLMVILGQQFFNHYVQSSLSLKVIDLRHFAMPAGLFFLTGVICSALYPLTVFFASGTTSLLKGRSKSNQGTVFRRALIVFQFLSGSLLIMATLAINLQMDFMNAKDKGMDMSRVLVLDGPTVKGSSWDQKRQRANLLTRRLNEMPEVMYAGVSTNIPGKPVARGRKLSRENNREAEVWSINEVRGSAYLEILNLRFIVGESFNRQSDNALINSDQSEQVRETVLNRSAVKQMGFANPLEALGSEVFGWTYSGSYPLKVVGVVEDYHHEGLQKAMRPMAFMSGDQWDYFYMVKLHGDILADVVEEIETIYESVHPGSPASFYFLDEFFQRQYHSEDVNRKVLTSFTIMAILVACIGLFGLSSFMALQRTKEIGIRKVLGARVKAVFFLLSKELILLATLGFLLAAPLGFYVIERWLEGYAYHIQISASFFVIPLLSILLLAILAIGPRVLKTAVMNPVKSLRHE